VPIALESADLPLEPRREHLLQSVSGPTSPRIEHMDSTGLTILDVLKTESLLQSVRDCDMQTVDTFGHEPLLSQIRQ
jgi:hypothetical protein